MCSLIGAGKNLIKELEIKFPTHGVMDVLGIVYLSYFLQLENDVSFAKHLEILKIVFIITKPTRWIWKMLWCKSS